MTLAPKDLQRLERSLRRHRVELLERLQHPDPESTDRYVPIAGQLRVLLCDAELPILITVAEQKNVALRIWGPLRPNAPRPPGAFLPYLRLIAGWDPIPDGHEMSVQEYLDTAIGGVPVQVGTGQGERVSWYTPRQLIKWVANKEGAAHLDLTLPATLEALNVTRRVMKTAEGSTTTDEFLVRSGIVQIAQWTLKAIDRVLAA